MPNQLTVGGVNVDLTANSAQLVKDMRTAAQATDRASKQMTRSLTGWGRGFDSVERRVAGFARKVRASLAGLSRIALPTIGIAGGLGAAGLVAATKQAANAADAIAKLSAVSGISTDALQALQFQAGQTGVSQEVLNSALVVFAKRTGEAAVGQGPLVSGLKNVNAALLEQITAAGSQEQRLRLIANAVKTASTASQRAAIVNAAFGRSAIVMAGSLATGASGMDAYARTAQQLGLIIERDLLESAESLNDRIDELSNSFRANFQRAILQSAPALENLVQKMVEAIPVVIRLGTKIAEFFGTGSGSDASALRTRLESVNLGIQGARTLLEGVGTRDLGEGNVDLGTIRRAQTLLPLLERERDLLMADLRLQSLITAKLGEQVDLAGQLTGSGAGAPSRPRLIGPSPARPAFAGRLPIPTARPPTFGPPAPGTADAAVLEAIAKGREISAALDERRAQMDAINDSAQTFAQTMSTGLSSVITRQQSLGEAFLNTTQRLADMVLQATLFRTIMAGVGSVGGGTGGGVASGFLGSIFGGGRQHGGSVNRGRGFLVGERGPEVFFPNTAGQVVANSELRQGADGGGVTIAFGPIDARGADPGTIAAVVNRFTQVAQSGMLETLARSPAARRAVGGGAPSF